MFGTQGSFFSFKNSFSCSRKLSTWMPAPTPAPWSTLPFPMIHQRASPLTGCTPRTQPLSRSTMTLGLLLLRWFFQGFVLKRMAYIRSFSGGPRGLQRDNICLWTDWVWQKLLYARNQWPSHAEGYHSTLLWAHIWGQNKEVCNCFKIYFRLLIQARTWSTWCMPPTLRFTMKRSVTCWATT